MAKAVYLVYGNDGYRVMEKATEIVNRLIPKQEQMTALEVVDGAVDTVDSATGAIGSCIGALRSVSLFSVRKLVWLRGVSFLKESRAGNSEEVKKRLDELGELIKAGLAADTYFLLTADHVDGRSRFFKTCSAAGEVFPFEVEEKRGSAEEAASYITDFLKKEKRGMEEDAMVLFLDKVGLETWHIVQELEKLIAYTEGRSVITRQDVDNVTSSYRESKGWDLEDAVGRKDLPGSLRLLRGLLFQKEKPIALAMSLERRFRELMVYRTGLDAGWLRRSGRDYRWGDVPPDGEDFLKTGFIKDPRSQHPFRVRVLTEQAERFSRVEISRWLVGLADLHERIVSSGVDDATMLEMLLVRMLAGAGRRNN